MFLDDDTKEFVRAFQAGGDHYTVWQTSDGMYHITRDLMDGDIDLIMQSNALHTIKDQIESLIEDGADYDVRW